MKVGCVEISLLKNDLIINNYSLLKSLQSQEISESSRQMVYNDKSNLDV